MDKSKHCLVPTRNNCRICVPVANTGISVVAPCNCSSPVQGTCYLYAVVSQIVVHRASDTSAAGFYCYSLSIHTAITIKFSCRYLCFRETACSHVTIPVFILLKQGCQLLDLKDSAGNSSK